MTVSVFVWLLILFNGDGLYKNTSIGHLERELIKIIRTAENICSNSKKRGN